MLIGFLTRYLKPEKRVNESADLREGPAIVEGVALRPAEPLRTPFKHTECVAYGYTAYAFVQSRQGTQQKAIRKALVQTAFEVKLADGGIVFAEPAQPGEPITEEEHRAIQAGDSVVVDEQPVVPLRRVRLEGMLKRSGERWTLKYRLLENIGASAELVQESTRQATKTKPAPKKVPRRDGKKKR